MLVYGCTGSGSYTEPASDFSGQTIRLIVPFGPGGAFDLHARLLARRLGTHVPGNPTVVVENMPGAGGLVAARYFAHQVRPDGLTLGIFSTGLVLHELITLEADRALDVSVDQFAVVGAPSPDIGICFFSSNSGISDFETWANSTTPPRMGMTGPGSGTFLSTWLVTDALSLPIRAVAGYSGTAEIKHAMDSGEVDGTCTTHATFAPVFGSQKTYPIAVQSGFEKSSKLPTVPLALDLAQSEESREMLRALALMRRIGRFYALPPGTPAVLAEQLRDAFLMTMEDPDLLADAKTLNLTIDPRSGEDVALGIASLLSLPLHTRERLMQTATKDSRRD